VSYFTTLSSGIRTTVKGLSITLQHLLGARRSRGMHSIGKGNYFSEPKGIFTMSWPEEKMEVPTVGRYTLDCEIDDCIVCDKCAKVCPVDCIDIVPIKSTEVFGYTSDGSAKRIYAAKFDIDMAKCCFSGLCTTVCPTECLTMTDDYTNAPLDVRQMVYPFATLTAEEAKQKQQDYDKAQEAKLAARATPPSPTDVASEPKPAGAKPQFRPVMKKPAPKPPEDPAEKQDPTSSTE